MSIKTMMRVWEHSETRGAARCLMLALADFANDDGICWPGTANLAHKIRENPDYTDQLIKKCIALGELEKQSGRGRGHTTRFAVLCGLGPDAQKRLKGVLQKGYSSTPIDKRGTDVSLLEKRVTPKGVLQSEKRGTLSDTKQAANGAAESPKTPIPEKQIHHDPGGDHESPPPTMTHDRAKSGGGDQILLRELLDRGVGQSSAETIAATHHDPPTILQSLDNMLADGEIAKHDRDDVIGRFVRRVQSTPPAPGSPYPRVRAAPKNGAPPGPLAPTKPNFPTDVAPVSNMLRRGTLKGHPDDTGTAT